MAKYFITDELSLGRALAALHADLFAAGLDDNCLFDCKLVFSELASNIVKHTTKGGEIRTEFFEERVEITTVGGAPFRWPQGQKCSAVYEESGRGLYLIDSVCHTREDTDDGVKVVLIRKK